MKRKPGGALSAESLIKTVSVCAKNILDETTRNKPQISLHDNILSAIAIFKLKYPSLLQFDNDRQDPAHAHSLKTLFHVDQALCVTPPCENVWTSWSHIGGVTK